MKAPHPQDEAARLAALECYRILDTPPDAVIDGIAQAAAALCETPMALISFIDPTRQWFKACIGIQVRETSRDHAFCTHAILEPDTLMEVEDATLDHRFRDNPFVVGEPRIRFYASKPLVTPEGLALGTLCVIDEVPRRLTAAQRNGLVQLARVLMDLLEERRGSRIAAIDRAVDQAARHGLLITDPSRPDNPITHANRAFETMTGYSKSELLGRNCRLLQGPDTDPDTVTQLREAIATHEPCTVVIKNYRKNGSMFWNELTVSPVRDIAGRTVNFVGIQQDVTDRILAEERGSALTAATIEVDRAQASRDRLARIMELAVNEIYVLDATTFRILEANRAARSNLGYSLEEIRQLKAWDCVEGFNRKRLEKLGTKLRGAEQESIDMQIVHRRRNGSTYPVECRLQLLSAQSPPVYVKISQDITERQRHEENTKLRERAIEAVDVGVSITDATLPGHPLVYVNRTLCEMTGHTLDELIGRPNHLVRNSEQNQAEHQLIQAAQVKGESCQVLLRCSRKDGSHYMNELSLSPVHNDAGDVTHYIGINRDVTARLATEARLRQSQKFDAIGQLSGGVAHDFNNLLSVITGNLEFLALDLVDREHRMYIDQAVKAAQMGARLTSRLLKFAQHSELEPVVLDVNDQIHATIELLRSTIGKYICLTSSLAPDLWRVRADPCEVESAVVNLVINARDAMPQGGSVTIASKNVRIEEEELTDDFGPAPGDYIQLSVADTGSGMTPEVQARVFEPFFTTKEPKRGTGMGLASIYGFVRQSGGHVAVHSEAGHGTDVHLYLPRHIESTATREAEQSAHHDSSKGSARILVVEDNDMVRQVTVMRLHALGFDTHEASNGPEAIRLLEADARFDLVLADIVLDGGMSGHDLAHWVRKNTSQCNILLISEFKQKAAEEEDVDVDGSSVLQKPYNLSELHRALDVVIGKSGPGP